MAKTKFNSIDGYISIFPKDVQKILEEVRVTIKKAVPNAEEAISYQIPTFKLNGKYLVYFAGWKKHVSLYPVSSGMEKSIKEMSAYKTSGKGTLQFPLDEPIPQSLIKKIVKYRVKETNERIKKNKNG